MCFAEFFFEVDDVLASRENEREDLLRDGFVSWDRLRGNNERNRFICRLHGSHISYVI